MNYFQESLILSFIARVWYGLLGYYETSLLHHIVNGFVRLYRHSLFYKILTYDSHIEPKWHESLFYRAVTWCLNIVPELLGRFRGRFARTFDESLFCRFLRFCGNRTAYFMGAFLMLLLLVPYSRWNNTYSLLLSMLGLGIFYLAAISNKKIRLSLSAIGPWPVLFATISCFSLLWSQDFSISLRYLFFAITCILVVLVLVNSVKSQRDLLRIVEFLALGLLVCTLYSVFQRISGVEVSKSFTDLDVNSDMPGRVFSFFKNPNAFANILVFFTPLMIAMIFYAPKWFEKLLFTGVSALCCLALLMTFSRGGWLSLAISLFILALILCPKWVPLFIIIGVFALPLLPDAIKGRLLSIFAGDSSISSRNYIYSAMVRLIEGNWFFGTGLGVSALKRGVSYYGVYQANFPFVHAHNIILEIWGESGLFATIAFIMSMFFSFRKAHTAKKKTKSPMLKAIIAGSVSGLAGSMIFGLTDYAWAFPRVMVLFWFLFAILYAAIKLANNGSQMKEGIING